MNVSEARATVAGDSGVAAFDKAWFRAVEPRLHVSFVARFGAELGGDSAADAPGYAWQHRDRALEMANPIGFTFRVGQRCASRQQRRDRRRFGLTVGGEPPPGFEPALHDALSAVPVRQRQVVVLCTGCSPTQRGTVDVLGISPSTVQNRTERGLLQLRRKVGP